MNPSPDERFEQVQSTLNQLSNSQRHLLTAHVLMNDRLDRTEANLEEASQTIKEVAAQQKELAAQQKELAAQQKELAAQQKDTQSNLDALIDLVRRWYERHGNGTGGQQPS